MLRRFHPFTVYLILEFSAALFFSLIFTVNMLYQVTVVGLSPLQLVLIGTTLEVSVFLFEVPTGVLPAVLIALFVNVFVAEAALVEEGPSMQPNLYVGYRVMTEKVSYRFHLPQRGDVVIASRPGTEKALIKRVVGLPGELVAVRGGHVFIDGRPISEPWISYFGPPDYPPTLIPPHHVFIVGDNRPNSRDSRAIGPVPISSIKGHAFAVYWPPDEARFLP